MKKLVALLLAVVLVLGLMTGALAADGELAGKTIILHTNDVHGAVGLYAKVAALKKDYAEKGADVILVDAGDYIQGTPYVSDSQGKTAIELMNAAGYDVATFGNHEFDYGFANLQTIFKDAKFKVIGNIQYNGKLRQGRLPRPDHAGDRHQGPSRQDPGRDLHGQGRAL